MKKSELQSYIRGEILNEMAIQEMAKISGDLKSSIEKVIQSNPDLEMLPLKKAIKTDADVQTALGGDSLYDNQLGKFISFFKGDREVGKRGRKSDPNKIVKPKSPTGKVGRPKVEKKKDVSLTTTKLGGKKYYTKKDKDSESEGPSNAELRKLASSGGDMGKDKSSQIKQQEKSKLIKNFLKGLRDKNIVDSSNKILDKEKYDIAWAEEKPKIQAAVSKINEVSSINEETNIGLADLEEMGYEAGEKAFEMASTSMDFKNKPDFKAYQKGFFQGFTDQAGAYDLNEASQEEVDNQKELNKELEKTADLKAKVGLEEEKKK